MFIFWDFIVLPGLQSCFCSMEPGRRKHLETFLSSLWQFFISLIFVHLYSWNLLLLLNFPENHWTEAPLFISLTSSIWPAALFNPGSTFEWIFSQVAISNRVTLRGNPIPCYLTPQYGQFQKAFNQKKRCFLQEACVLGFHLSFWVAEPIESSQSTPCNCVSFAALWQKFQHSKSTFSSHPAFCKFERSWNAP